MEQPILEVRDLHQTSEVPGVAGRAGDQLHVRHVDLIGVGVVGPAQQPEGTELLGRHTALEQRTLGDGRAFEHLVQPRDRTTFRRSPAGHAGEMPQHGCSVLFEVSFVQPRGHRACIEDLRHRAHLRAVRVQASDILAPCATSP
jgi:hypothetical protein